MKRTEFSVVFDTIQPKMKLDVFAKEVEATYSFSPDSPTKGKMAANFVIQYDAEEFVTEALLALYLAENFGDDGGWYLEDISDREILG